jgi:hypothetical protein
VEWRRYDRNTDFEAEEPFSPTANKMYPPTGLRVPRVPEFLVNDNISDTARTTSIASSRSLSRSNSFSSSPVRGRSRENSFSNLTHICRRQPESEEEEYLPISEPATPVQVPMPNTVNIDLSLAREAERRAAQAAVVAEEPLGQPSASLQKFKKVSLVQPQPAAVSIAPAYMPSAAAPAVPANGPKVVTLSAPSKWNQARESAARSSAEQFAAPPSAASSAAAPTLVIQSSTAQPLAAPAMMAADAPRSRMAEAPATGGGRATASNAHVQPQSAEPVPYQAAEPVVMSFPVTGVVPPAPVPPAPALVPGPTAVAAPRPPVPDQPAVGFKYSLKFPTREASEGAELPHVYDVNAAYEEAYQSAKARMHRGDADENDEDQGSDEYDEEDGVPALTYPQASTTNRMSFRGGLMAKQKSMSRRASKVLLDDEQVINFMTSGFQAIKVHICNLRFCDLLLKRNRSILLSC